MVSGLLCWRDSHPLEWQLASLNGVAGFAAGGSSSDRKRSRPIRAFSATPHDGQRPCRTLAEDLGRTQPRAAYLRRCSSNASGLPGRNSVRILGIRVSSAGVARASIPAEILAYAAYPKRCSSNANGLGGQTSAGFWKSVRPFKGIFCVDVSEFESYMPSQAVRSPPADIRA